MIFLTLGLMTAKAQQGQNEFESKRSNGDLPALESAVLVTTLHQSDSNIFSRLQNIFKNKKLKPAANDTALATGSKQSQAGTNLDEFQTELSGAFDQVTNGDNTAIIVVYRSFSVVTGANPSFNPDFSSLNVKVFHKKSKTATDYSNYLLATKTVYFVLIDISNDYFQANKDKVDQQLSASTIKVNYRTSYFKQSFQAIQGVWKAMGGNTSSQLGLTLIKVTPSRIKDPCDIVLSNKSFKSDQTFTIHENNVASFQVGVSNSKLAINNISIAGGNLVVKPDANQSTSWKSDAYAIVELHIPRDIDNFRPLWKSLFSKRPDDKTFDFGNWLCDNTISRIGIYGGVKIAKDPISNLYAGFNYAVTKDIGFNFGWAWVNDYATQVTDVGAISSVSDALKYAKREYSKGKFSIGISFSPSAFSTAVGLKSKSADSGN